MLPTTPEKLGTIVRGPTGKKSKKPDLDDILNDFGYTRYSSILESNDGELGIRFVKCYNPHGNIVYVDVDEPVMVPYHHDHTYRKSESEYSPLEKVKQHLDEFNDKISGLVSEFLYETGHTCFGFCWLNNKYDHCTAVYGKRKEVVLAESHYPIVRLREIMHHSDLINENIQYYYDTANAQLYEKLVSVFNTINTHVHEFHSSIEQSGNHTQECLEQNFKATAMLKGFNEQYLQIEDKDAEQVEKEDAVKRNIAIRQELYNDMCSNISLLNKIEKHLAKAKKLAHIVNHNLTKHGLHVFEEMH